MVLVLDQGWAKILHLYVIAKINLSANEKI